MDARFIVLLLAMGYCMHGQLQVEGAPAESGDEDGSGGSGDEDALPGLGDPPGTTAPPWPAGPTPIRYNGTVKCEGDTAWLRCNEYKHISLISAFWGRRDSWMCTEHTGNLLTNKHCPTTSVFLTKVKDACEGTTMCEVRCTKFFFHDKTCPDVYKYLVIYFKCKACPHQ